MTETFKNATGPSALMSNKSSSEDFCPCMNVVPMLKTSPMFDGKSLRCVGTCAATFEIDPGYME